jgi:DNA-binding NarL/FixJ family response regulator
VKRRVPRPPRQLSATRVSVGEAELVVFEWPESFEVPDAPPVSKVSPRVPLSPRERVVADFLARGYQNLQIAANLGVSVHTIRHQVASILRKTGACNRTDFAAWWLSQR